jgi:hypothetical protein
MQAGATPTSTVTFSKVNAPHAKLQGTSPKEFDKGYLPPNAARGYKGITMVNQGLRNNLTVNGGSGNDTLKFTNAQRQSQAGKPKRLSGDFNGDGDVDGADFLLQNKAAQSYPGSANRRGILIGQLLPQVAEKTTGASGQSIGHNANPQVKKPRR